MVSRRGFLGAGTAFLCLEGAASCAARPPTLYRPADVSAEEHAQTIAAMRPPKRARPVVAVLADNDGSETTDYVAPWSVLTRAGVADVHALALRAAPIVMHPVLRIEPSATTADFDRTFSDGADYVIVPALHDPRSPGAIAWIRSQHAKGATIMSICAGALVLAHAGLLEGRAATTHWSSIDDMRRLSPRSTWRANRRYVADRGIITTTGVSASLPASLALVEAIAGRPAAETLAANLGVASFGEGHDSAAFTDKTVPVYARGGLNLASGREDLALRIADGVDELALAFTADAWSRTYRSRCLIVADVDRVRTQNGLTIVADRRDAGHLRAVTLPDGAPGRTLDGVLPEIAARYGAPTAAFVATQLEYPHP